MSSYSQIMDLNCSSEADESSVILPELSSMSLNSDQMYSPMIQQTMPQKLRESLSFHLADLLTLPAIKITSNTSKLYNNNTALLTATKDYVGSNQTTEESLEDTVEALRRLRATVLNL